MELEIFKENGWEIRTVSRDGEPWFVAKDVCDSLGIQNASKAVSVLDDDERSSLKIGLGGSANAISESGMYTIILRSRDAVIKGTKAHSFKRWVTREVLPAIRKRGEYVISDHKREISERDAKLAELAIEIKNRNKALALASGSVDFKDYATNKGKEWSILDAKNDFGMSLSDFRSYLRSVKFFDKRVFQSGAERWWPKPKFFDSGYVKRTDMGVNYAFTVKGMEWATVLIEDGPEDAKARFELERQLDLFGEGV